jgi:streptogramin lyase
LRNTRVIAASAALAACLCGVAAGGAAPRIDEYPVPTQGAWPLGIAAGPDGDLWFTEYGAAQVGRITTGGAIREFAAPSPSSSPAGMTAGADGNLWFAELDANKIARITLTGSTTDFPVPTANAEPAGIATGPDGNLWFTELSGNKIGRLTPGGGFTEFDVLTPASRPYSIAAGPDGNMWFTENLGDRIGRITTGGAVTEFPLTSGSKPEGIAAGPDGAIWFAESGRNRIGRIPVSGSPITEYRLPTSHSGPDYLVAASDGAFWLTEPDANKIGRLTTSGNAVDYDVPSSGQSNDLGNIAAAPDGDVWFSEATANNIGRVRVALSGTRYVLVRSLGFRPATRRTSQGTTIEWSFYGPTSQSVTDTTGLGLFDSGTRSFVSYYSFTFAGAGTYRYQDALHPALTGAIAVPIAVSPHSGGTGTTFTVTWASAPPGAGRVFDVRIRRPGSPSYVDWRTGQTGTSATFVPDAGTGVYSFRARPRSSGTGARSGWSPAASIVVS